MSAAVSVHCFGKFRVMTASGEMKFRTEKAEELLAFLINSRGCFVNRNEIMDSLWEEYDGDRALVHFNTTLHYLKKALLRYGIQIPVEYDRGSYRLDISGLECDFCRFDAGTAADGKANIAELEEIAGLYTGDYFSGRDYGWAERKRQMLKDQYISLLLQITDYYNSCSKYKKVVEWTKTGLLHEPLHRELNFRLIEALLLSNDRISALKYHDIYRNGLRKRFKLEPDDAFKRLF
jgi:LuxR family maltose regulon positive regulatory protein